MGPGRPGLSRQSPGVTFEVGTLDRFRQRALRPGQSWDAEACGGRGQKRFPRCFSLKELNLCTKSSALSIVTSDGGCVFVDFGKDSFIVRI